MLARSRFFVAACVALTSGACEGQGRHTTRPAGAAIASAQAPAMTSAPEAGEAPSGSPSRPPLTPLDEQVRALDALHHMREAAISPDGNAVAWVDQSPRPTGDGDTSSIFVLDRRHPTESPQRITVNRTAVCRERAIAWSADSRHLAFLSDAANAGTDRLYVADAAASGGPYGAPRAITEGADGALDRPEWSPDGQSIALLVTAGTQDVPGPLAPVAPPSGSIEEHTPVQRVGLVDASAGNHHPVRLVSPPDLYVYEIDWSPDGKQMAMTASHGPGDSAWFGADLYVLDVANEKVRQLVKPPGQVAKPRFSPDGRSIAFIAGLMSDEGSTGGDVYSVPAAGGAARDLTPGLSGSASSLRWLTAPDRLVITEMIDGASAIASVSPEGGPVETLWSGDAAVRTLSMSADGAVSAVVKESFESAPAVYAGRTGDWQAVSHANDAFRPRWGRARSVHFDDHGVRAQGWLLAPHDVAANERYPMIVVVHGGPGAASWPTVGAFDLAAANGFFVFFPNPRGSFGRGEAFTRANVRDLGHGDLEDVLAGVDEVLRTAPVDPRRLGITGWSYGGFMTMWAVTQTHRFRAAVAGAGISDWRSYWGENTISGWLVPFFGATVYDDPQVYERSSPIAFIKQVRTPTLLIVGDSDGECPAPQSFEFWRALKTLGVETKLVVYPHEGHHLRAPEHRRDRVVRTLQWFQEHLETRSPRGEPAGP